MLSQCMEPCACIAAMPCRNIYSFSQSVSVCLWAGVISAEYFVLRNALTRWKLSSQLKSIVYQDANCKTGSIALVQRLPPGTHKTDGSISTQPFTSALQLGRNANRNFQLSLLSNFTAVCLKLKHPPLVVLCIFIMTGFFFFFLHIATLRVAFHWVFNAYKNTLS